MAIGNSNASYCSLYDTGIAHDDLEAFYRLARCQALIPWMILTRLWCLPADLSLRLCVECLAVVLGDEHDACNFPDGARRVMLLISFSVRFFWESFWAVASVEQRLLRLALPPLQAELVLRAQTMWRDDALALCDTWALSPTAVPPGPLADAVSWSLERQAAGSVESCIWSCKRGHSSHAS
jgi:hypothetical protein